MLFLKLMSSLWLKVLFSAHFGCYCCCCSLALSISFQFALWHTKITRTHIYLWYRCARGIDIGGWCVCVFVCLWLCALIFALFGLFLIANMTFLFVLLVCLKFYYLLLLVVSAHDDDVTQTRMFNFNFCFRNGAAVWKKTIFSFKFWKHLSSLIVPHLVLV